MSFFLRSWEMDLGETVTNPPKTASRFTGFVTCLTQVHFPWTQKKRHSFLNYVQSWKLSSRSTFVFFLWYLIGLIHTSSYAKTWKVRLGHLVYVLWSSVCLFVRPYSRLSVFRPSYIYNATFKVWVVTKYTKLDLLVKQQNDINFI